MGSLRINLTDSPFSDAKALLVTFSEVSVHRADGDAWETVDFTSGSSRVLVFGFGLVPIAIMWLFWAPPQASLSESIGKARE